MSFAANHRSQFHRALVKLSGQSFSGAGTYGIDREAVTSIAEEIAGCIADGRQVATVVGAGNIWRGREAAAEGMDQATADYAGMVATVVNSLALQDALERLGMETRVQSAIEMRQVAEPFIRRRAIRHLEKGRVVIFAAGTGNPFFTTDTAAVLRGAEIGAEVIIKATDVAGVYDKDPQEYSDARLFAAITYLDVLSQGLKVMDATAISLSMDNDLPIVVCDLTTPHNIRRVLAGEAVGTYVGECETVFADEQVGL